jgi:hypothetical protein
MKFAHFFRERSDCGKHGIQIKTGSWIPQASILFCVSQLPQQQSCPGSAAIYLIPSRLGRA